MSNRNWNTQTANSRDGKGGVKGNWSDRGSISIPNPVNAGAVTTKGIAPTSEGKESGGTSFSISKGKVSGTAQGMGAAKKGGKYHWVGPNDTKW
jgi:hypothetical protein